MSLPQYLQILPTTESLPEVPIGDRWQRLVFLANSGWFGRSPGEVIRQANTAISSLRDILKPEIPNQFSVNIPDPRFGDNYLKSVLELPLGVPINPPFTSPSTRKRSEVQMGWADDDSIEGGMYGDLDFVPPFSHVQDECTVGMLPSKLLCHPGVQHAYISPNATIDDISDYDLILMNSSGTWIKNNSIYLNPSYLINNNESGDAIHIADGWYIKSQSISAPPILTTTDRVPLKDSNDLPSSLNTRRNLTDVYLTFMSDVSIPPNGIYYYEVKIKGDIYIGFSQAEVTGNFWTSSSLKNTKASLSWGKEGHVEFMVRTFDSRLVRWKSHKQNWAKFGDGDVIGLGVDFTRNVVFGVKNGIYAGECKDSGIFEVDFRIAVTMSKGSEANINIGQEIERVFYQNGEAVKQTSPGEFLFDIVGYVRNRKREFKQKIQKQKFTEFDLDGELIKNDVGLSKFAEKLVMGYLKHKGYLESVKGFQRDLKDFNGTATSKETDDDWEQLTSLKKRLKLLLMTEDYDEILKIMGVAFPGFWKAFERIEFQLFSLKYIKLIKMSSKSNNFEKMLRFGKALRRKYGSDPIYCSIIDDISQLISYEDPTTSPQWENLADLGKQKVKEALIMSINESIDKSCLSGLDLGILKADAELERISKKNKEAELVDILSDYIKG